MKKGDYIKTPRFLKVKLEEVFNSKTVLNMKYWENIQGLTE